MPDPIQEKYRKSMNRVARATSTSDLVGAMRNWISQVRKKARAAG